MSTESGWLTKMLCNCSEPWDKKNNEDGSFMNRPFFSCYYLFLHAIQQASKVSFKIIFKIIPFQGKLYSGL